MLCWATAGEGPLEVGTGGGYWWCELVWGLLAALLELDDGVRLWLGLMGGIGVERKSPPTSVVERSV